MAEAAQRRYVQRVLKRAKLDPIAVENRVGPGTPDVNFAYGWIELKWLKAWPKREGIVRISHFTTGQRRWLQRRWVCSSNAWLLLQVGREWLLFDGATAAADVGNQTRQYLREVCVGKWDDGLDREEFVKCLEG